MTTEYNKNTQQEGNVGRLRERRFICSIPSNTAVVPGAATHDQKIFRVYVCVRARSLARVRDLSREDSTLDRPATPVQIRIHNDVIRKKMSQQPKQTSQTYLLFALGLRYLDPKGCRGQLRCTRLLTVFFWSGTVPNDRGRLVESSKTREKERDTQDTRQRHLSFFRIFSRFASACNRK